MNSLSEQGAEYPQAAPTSQNRSQHGQNPHSKSSLSLHPHMGHQKGYHQAEQGKIKHSHLVQDLFSGKPESSSTSHAFWIFPLQDRTNLLIHPHHSRKPHKEKPKKDERFPHVLLPKAVSSIPKELPALLPHFPTIRSCSLPILQNHTLHEIGTKIRAFQICR